MRGQSLSTPHDRPKGCASPFPTHGFWDNTSLLPSTGQTFTPRAGEQGKEKLQTLNTDSDGHTLDQPSDLPWWFNCICLFRFVPSRARGTQGWTNTSKKAMTGDFFYTSAEMHELLKCLGRLCCSAAHEVSMILLFNARVDNLLSTASLLLDMN